jgi:NADH:ubiquinone oxidoreductase subunit 4 (subunit M)
MTAIYYFFIYTILGSLFLLIGLILLYIELGTNSLIILYSIPLNENYQLFLWILFFFSFAIKIPLFPFHIWLPYAHTESSTVTSIYLAAILLKLGLYGFIRFSIPLFPLGSLFFKPLIITLALLSIIYTSFSAFSLIDLKQIIAYSSIAHMNTSLIGLFSNDLNGIIGSILYGISHGIISSALFLLIGLLYERYHTRIIKYYRGLT